MARQLSSLEHVWPLCDECVTAFQRPPRGDLWRLGESVLRSRVSYPPAPPKAPPRGCSRAVSCVGRPTHQDEPQAPWRACSGRYAAVGVWVARPTMGLVAHRLWVRNRTVNSAGNLPAAVQLRWLAVVQLCRDRVSREDRNRLGLALVFARGPPLLRSSRLTRNRLDMSRST